MRIFVTGREGQVARSLAERSSSCDIEIVALGRPEFDLSGPQRRIANLIEIAEPDVIVSAAAYTDVDKAESEPDIAFAVNCDGARSIARAARELGVPLIHLSTDYVFDGLKAVPYVEDDATRPAGVYGASKLAGEQAVLAEYDNVAVLRTAWVYSPFGRNFVKTMLQLASDRDEIPVVADQRGNPTNAFDIADAIFQVALNLLATPNPDRRGIFHMTASGEASWADFAEAIFERSEAVDGPSAIVKHIESAAYPRPAKRPANSRLDSGKLERAHGVRLPDWRLSLKPVVSRLVDLGA